MTFHFKDHFWQIWEENRRLTLKVAHTFSDEGVMQEKPVPKMRSFDRMLLEIAGLERFFMSGLAEDTWEWNPDVENHPEISNVTELFSILDETRSYTKSVWPKISEEKLLTMHKAPQTFAGPDARPLDWLQYALENEIHHRGQGYTYLRCLGIKPPMFWDRS